MPPIKNGRGTSGRDEPSLLGNILKVACAILVVCALLSFTQYFLGWKKNATEVENRLTRSPFFISHVYDPNVDGIDYGSRTQRDWMQWRIVRDRKLKSHGKKPLAIKSLNTVIIASPHEFRNAFPNPIPGDGNFWSDIRFPAFVFLNGKVYHCPPSYIQVTFEEGSPVHFHRQSHCKESENLWGNNNACRVKLKKDCILVE